MKLLEKTIANQLGMTLMDYEGIKRQRAVSMIQAILQLLLLFGVFETMSKKNVIDETSVYTSVISATLNSIFQIFKLRLGSQAVHEPFFQYCSKCLMARIA